MRGKLKEILLQNYQKPSKFELKKKEKALNCCGIYVYPQYKNRCKDVVDSRYDKRNVKITSKDEYYTNIKY